MSDPIIQKRLEDLERQISLYERLFQSFSSKLDHHFKKYDVLISSQQQQINMLTDALSTMLNDQYRYSEILRDKLGTALSSVSATHVSMRGIDGQRVDQRQQQQGQGQQQSQQTQQDPQGQQPALANVDAFLEDFMTPEVEMPNPVPRRAKLGSFQTKPTRMPTNHPVEDSFRSLDVDVPVAALQNVGVGVVNARQMPTTASNKRKNGSSSTVTDVANRSLNQQSSGLAQNQAQVSQLEEEKYFTGRGQSKKRKIYTGKFKFFNSPQSIMDIWKEYTEGFDGQPSIKEMEQMYHVSWRREPAMNKRYHRRRVLCKAIERGVEKGFHLQEILRMLEDARIADAERGTKHPISWICQFSHIPEILR